MFVYNRYHHVLQQAEGKYIARDSNQVLTNPRPYYLWIILDALKKSNFAGKKSIFKEENRIFFKPLLLPGFMSVNSIQPIFKKKSNLKEKKRGKNRFFKENNSIF